MHKATSMLAWEVIRFIAIDLFWNVVTFPIWWYTRGTLQVLRLISREARSFARSYNLAILFRFLLTPMFGQYDIVGRIISFFVRIVHFGVLSVLTLIYTIALIVLLVVWLAFPVFVVYNLLYQLQLMPSIYG